MKGRAGWLTLAVCVIGCSGGSSEPGVAAGSAGSSASPVSDAAANGTDAAANGTVDAASTHAANPKLAAIAAGSALDLGRYSCSSPAGEDPSSCRKMTDYSGFAYDPRNHQMLAFGGGHATTMTDSIAALPLGGDLVWKALYASTPCMLMGPSNLDSALGAWKSGPSGPYPRPISAHTYDFHGVAVEQNEFVLLGRLFTGGSCSGVGNDVNGPIAHFDLGKQTWSFSPDPDTSAFVSNMSATALDPIMNVFIALGSGGLSTYDAGKRAMQHVADTLPSASGKAVAIDSLGYANHMVYFPPLDTFYYFVRGTPVATYALKLERADLAHSTLDVVPTQGPTSPHQEPAYDYDATNHLIGGGIAANTFYVYDPMTSAWSSQPIAGGMPGTLAFHALRYDPIDNVFVFVSDYESGQRTWAYRYK